MRLKIYLKCTKWSWTLWATGGVAETPQLHSPPATLHIQKGGGGFSERGEVTTEVCSSANPGATQQEATWSVTVTSLAPIHSWTLREGPRGAPARSSEQSRPRVSPADLRADQGERWQTKQGRADHSWSRQDWSISCVWAGGGGYKP